MRKQFLEIGKIVSIQGIKGEVRVNPWCDTPDFLLEFDCFYFDGEGKEKTEVEHSRVQKNVVILKLSGIDTPEKAQSLRNKLIYIDRNEVELSENTYFVQDLEGLAVFDADNEAICYGIITEVSQTGANDVYHIKDGNGKTVLVPAIRDVIIETDIDNSKMLIRPLRGLFDDED